MSTVLNKLRSLIFGDIYYFTWEGETDHHPFVNEQHIDCNYEFVHSCISSSDEVCMYIDDVGGYVPVGTKLFIHKRKVYKQL